MKAKSRKGLRREIELEVGKKGKKKKCFRFRRPTRAPPIPHSIVNNFIVFSCFFFLWTSELRSDTTQDEVADKLRYRETSQEKFHGGKAGKHPLIWTFRHLMRHADALP